MSYNLQPGNQNNATGSSTNLSANTYTITVTDQVGCTVQTTIAVNQPAVLQWSSVTQTAINCNGGTDGSITATATGGNGALSYNLQPGNLTNATGNFTNLGAATYTITVTDANNCSTNTTVTLTDPVLLALNASGIDPLCNGGNGSLSFSATGGTGAISYTVNGIAQTSPFVTIAGTYTITATDINGCTSQSVLTITDPALLQISNISSTTPSCVPGNDGSLTITATGGTPAYQYNVNGGTNQAANIFNGLGSAVYTIQVTDANGCTVTSTPRH